MSIYVDYAATTPIDESILQEMLNNADKFGNPSSIHRIGKEAKAFYEQSRQRVAKHLNARADEIVFTGSATEANNFVIRGISGFYEKPHIITTNVEHASVKETFDDIKENVDITYLNVNEAGLIDVDELKAALRPETKLVSIIMVNNETGTIQPVEAIANVLNETDALFHIDAVQAFKQLPIDVKALSCDFLTLSGHKLNAPKGIGVLYVKNNTHIKRMITGGSQERERRAGTENTLYAYAMSLAVEKAAENRERNTEQLNLLKDSFIKSLEDDKVPFEINGDISNQTGHILNLYFPWSESEYLLTALDMKGVYASGGSACNAGTVVPSHVITAMYDKDRSKHSLRFSFSEQLSPSDIKTVSSALSKIYNNLNENGFI